MSSGSKGCREGVSAVHGERNTRRDKPKTGRETSRPEDEGELRTIISRLHAQVERLNSLLERLGVGYFLDLHRKPLRLFWVNLLAGMGRGLGFVIGATVLVALILWLLKPFFSVPVLGKWIAKIAEVVRENMLRGAPPQ